MKICEALNASLQRDGKRYFENGICWNVDARNLRRLL